MKLVHKTLDILYTNPYTKGVRFLTQTKNKGVLTTMTDTERENLQILVTKFFISTGIPKNRAYGVATTYSDSQLEAYAETIDLEKLEIDLLRYRK